LPEGGYTSFMKNILNHPRIRVELGIKFLLRGDEDLTVYTGSIDEWFGFVYGHLPYRSLSFEHGCSLEQKAATINYCGDEPYTRITKFGKEHLLKEFPRDKGEPFYPILTQENRNLFKRYLSLVDSKVLFVGRLARYAYLNMDQAIAAALKAGRLR